MSRRGRTAVAQFVPQDAELHVAGCAKGCAHPAAARLTLVATQDGFDLIRDDVVIKLDLKTPRKK